MANPNIVNVTAMYGVTTYYTPPGTTAVVLLANAASSGKIYKINQIIVTNVDDGTNAVTATVSIYTNGVGVQGSAPSGGTEYAIASTIPVPANAWLTVIDKSTSFYLQEGNSIIIRSGVGDKLVFTVSYEDIS